jgi:hypothetical protein
LSVFTTEWVRIFLIDDVKNKQVSIQVEVSHLGSVRHEDDSDVISEGEMEKKDRLRLVLEN